MWLISKYHNKILYSYSLSHFIFYVIALLKIYIYPICFEMFIHWIVWIRFIRICCKYTCDFRNRQNFMHVYFTYSMCTFNGIGVKDAILHLGTKLSLKEIKRRLKNFRNCSKKNLLWEEIQSWRTHLNLPDKHQHSLIGRKGYTISIHVYFTWWVPEYNADINEQVHVVPWSK